VNADHEDQLGRHRPEVRVGVAGVDGSHLDVCESRRGRPGPLGDPGMHLDQRGGDPIGVVSICQDTQHVSAVSRAAAQDVHQP